MDSSISNELLLKISFVDSPVVELLLNEVKRGPGLCGSTPVRRISQLVQQLLQRFLKSPAKPVLRIRDILVRIRIRIQIRVRLLSSVT
jgi:hypothetical protein